MSRKAGSREAVRARLDALLDDVRGARRAEPDAGEPWREPENAAEWAPPASRGRISPSSASPAHEPGYPVRPAATTGRLVSGASRFAPATSRTTTDADHGLPPSPTPDPGPIPAGAGFPGPRGEAPPGAGARGEDRRGPAFHAADLRERGLEIGQPDDGAGGRPRRADVRRGTVRPAADVGAALLARFTGRHLVVVAAIGLIGLVAAVWTMSQARAIPVEAATPTPLATTAPLTSEASATPQPTIRVHVVGAVARPGVVSVPEGARVEDALAAAGGLLPQARPGELNLAQVLSDGAQILIGTGEASGEVRGDTGTSAAAGTGAAAGTPVDLNKANAEQLDGLPGVGPVTAQRILAWREAHGRFTRVDELAEVEGIGAKTLERLTPLVRV